MRTYRSSHRRRPSRRSTIDHRVTDDAMLQQLAGVFAEGGWAPTVADGGFTHEFSAPSAGSPPWHVYEITLENVYAVATKEPGGAARWSF
jgi:hypothetical protein